MYNETDKGIRKCLLCYKFLRLYENNSDHMIAVYWNSFFYQNVSILINGWDYLLGDSAYPLFNFLIKPFINTQNDLQIQFNIIHSLHRVVVKNAFGRLKNRFGCLKELNVKKILLAKTIRMIKAIYLIGILDII